MNQSAITRIEAILDRYCFGYHLFLRDHRSGDFYESGERRPYPIASCFKFAVAHAVFSKLEQEGLPSSTKLKLNLGEDYSGTSILASLSGQSLELEIQQFAELMISTSDGLATDRLIEWVGLNKVSQSLIDFAPNSSLPVNLDEMVRGVWSLPDVAKIKFDVFSRQQSYVLLDSVIEFGQTNAEDLASLAQNCYPPKFGVAKLNEDFFKAIAIELFIPRCEMFFTPETPKCISKTGSLFGRYFMNDLGVFISEESQQSIASFAYCSHGWKIAPYACDTVGGLVGLEISTAFGLPAVPNSNWSPQTESLFLSGI